MAGLVEPSADEFAEITVLGDAFAWTGRAGNGNHVGTVAGSLPALIGMPAGGGSIAEFANVDSDDNRDELRNWKYGDVLDDSDLSMVPMLNIAPAISVKRYARSPLNAAKILAGVVKSRRAAQDYDVWKIQTIATPAPITLVGRVASLLGQTAKMSELVDIALNREVPLMDPTHYTAMHARFNTVVHRPGRVGEEPSIHKMTALMALLQMQSCYVEFAIWGAHQILTAKAFRCTGLGPGPIGSKGRYVVTTKELKGPPDYARWRACWNVFQVAIIFAGVCTPLWLERYADMIMGYNAMYADKFGFNAVWAFLDQCENTCRYEHMPRMLRAASMKLDRLITRSSDGKAKPYNDMDDVQLVDFDHNHPFEYLWSMPEKTWWCETFQTKANFVVVKVIGSEAYLDGDARIVASHM